MLLPHTGIQTVQFHTMENWRISISHISLLMDGSNDYLKLIISGKSLMNRTCWVLPLTCICLCICSPLAPCTWNKRTIFRHPGNQTAWIDPCFQHKAWCMNLNTWQMWEKLYNFHITRKPKCASALPSSHTVPDFSDTFTQKLNIKCLVSLHTLTHRIISLITDVCTDEIIHVSREDQSTTLEINNKSKNSQVYEENSGHVFYLNICSRLISDPWDVGTKPSN